MHQITMAYGPVSVLVEALRRAVASAFATAFALKQISHLHPQLLYALSPCFTPGGSPC